MEQVSKPSMLDAPPEVIRIGLQDVGPVMREPLQWLSRQRSMISLSNIYLWVAFGLFTTVLRFNMLRLSAGTYDPAAKWNMTGPPAQFAVFGVVLPLLIWLAGFWLWLRQSRRFKTLEGRLDKSDLAQRLAGGDFAHDQIFEYTLWPLKWFLPGAANRANLKSALMRLMMNLDWYLGPPRANIRLNIPPVFGMFIWMPLLWGQVFQTAYRFPLIITLCTLGMVAYEVWARQNAVAGEALERYLRVRFSGVDADSHG